MAYEDVNPYNPEKKYSSKKNAKSNYNNMCNVKKTVIHIPKLRVGQYLLLFDVSYYLKIFTYIFKGLL